MKIIVLKKVEQFILSLTPKEVAKTFHVIELLEEFKHTLGMPHSKFLDEGIFELRIRSMRQIRIFYCFHNTTIYLMHAYIKKTMKVSDRELLHAKKVKMMLK